MVIVEKLTFGVWDVWYWRCGLVDDHGKMLTRFRWYLRSVFSETIALPFAEYDYYAVDKQTRSATCSSGRGASRRR